MLKIAEEIGGLLRQLPEKKDAKKKLKIFLPQQASYIQTMIAT